MCLCVTTDAWVRLCTRRHLCLRGRIGGGQGGILVHVLLTVFVRIGCARADAPLGGPHGRKDTRGVLTATECSQAEVERDLQARDGPRHRQDAHRKVGTLLHAGLTSHPPPPPHSMLWHGTTRRREVPPRVEISQFAAAYSRQGVARLSVVIRRRECPSGRCSGPPAQSQY
jgi:hypothetical protein